MGPVVGTVVVLAGGAGSGKTTVGRAVSAATGAQLLDLDAVTADLVAERAAAEPSRSEPELLAALRDERYRLLVATARSARDSHDVIVTAPFTGEIADPTAWAELVRDLGGEPVHLVWLSVTPEERLARLRSRGSSRDAHLLDAGAAPEVPPPVVPHLALTARQPTAALVQAISPYIGHRRP